MMRRVEIDGRYYDSPCDQCKDVYIPEEWLEDGKWKHCPNCGAKLDKEEN